MSSDAIRGIIEARLPSQYEPLLLTFYGDDVKTDGNLIIFGDDYDQRQLVRQLREQFVNIDAKALDQFENWWAVVLEQMEDGLL